jgi:hypothetical protein
MSACSRATPRRPASLSCGDSPVAARGSLARRTRAGGVGSAGHPHHRPADFVGRSPTWLVSPQAWWRYRTGGPPDQRATCRPNRPGSRRGAHGLHDRIDPLGEPLPTSNAASAPSSSAAARFAADRLVTHIRKPAAEPMATSAVDTPPPAPWTNTVAPGVARWRRSGCAGRSAGPAPAGIPEPGRARRAARPAWPGWGESRWRRRSHRRGQAVRGWSPRSGPVPTRAQRRPRPR